LEKVPNAVSHGRWCKLLTNLRNTQYNFCDELTTLQIIDQIPDIVAAEVLYIQAAVLTGSVQIDKLHAQN